MEWREEAKRRAAVEATKHIKDGDIVGLGSGSTVAYVVKEIGRLIRENKLKIKGIATSSQITKLAISNEVPLTTLDSYPQPDIAIDGADQVDSKLNMIKGLGGALTREKIVDNAAKKLIIVVDETKLTDRLGVNHPIPLEVIPFALATVLNELNLLNGKCILRMKDGKPMVTDNGNFIVDVYLNQIKNLRTLNRHLKLIPGVVETGIFLDMADVVYVGCQYGGIRKLTKHISKSTSDF